VGVRPAVQLVTPVYLARRRADADGQAFEGVALNNQGYPTAYILSLR
jgi:hypothetical protein